MAVRSWENFGLIPSQWASATLGEKFWDPNLSVIYISTLMEFLYLSDGTSKRSLHSDFDVASLS